MARWLHGCFLVILLYCLCKKWVTILLFVKIKLKETKIKVLLNMLILFQLFLRKWWNVVEVYWNQQYLSTFYFKISIKQSLFSSTNLKWFFTKRPSCYPAWHFTAHLLQCADGKGSRWLLAILIVPSPIYDLPRCPSSTSGVATGASRGKSAPLTVKNLPKIWKRREQIGKKRVKEGKNWEKEEKSGRFFHFAPPDR